ncbi:MAG: helix-turn-helix domain-containing protein [Fibrobacteres bacterium]|nr:helix-turn-helix domain-containing protein [Fibrobacterota bacterium]
MKIKWLVGFTWVLITLPVFGNDTLTPAGRLVEPAAFSLVTGNVIQFSAEAGDKNGRGIKEVRYYGQYHSAVDSTEQQQSKFNFLGSSSTPPYYFRWDCSDLPDQDNWRMAFYCDIEDSNGHVTHQAGGIHRHIVLDRNTTFSSKQFSSSHVSSPLLIDGSSGDWPKSDTLRFRSNDNDISALSAWDSENLYFFITVRDNRLWKMPSDTLFYWWYDGLELYLDLLRDRTPFRKLDDRQLDLHLSRSAVGNQIDLTKGVYKRWKTGFTAIQKPIGTLNNNSDIDSGYVVELAIRWDSLGVFPKPNDSLGFDLFNDDNDFGTLYPVTRSWAGTERSNNNNPSEWGTLVLLPPEKNFTKLLYLSAVLPVIAIFLFLRNRKRAGFSQTDTEVLDKPVDNVIPKTNAVADYLTGYLTKNFTDPDMSLAKAAADLKMSESHLRHSLKKATGRNFSEFLTELRMSKAKTLLQERLDMNISQISMECGFSSLEYFTQVFKKQMNGDTPLNYRRSLKKT